MRDCLFIDPPTTTRPCCPALRRPRGRGTPASPSSPQSLSHLRALASRVCSHFQRCQFSGTLDCEEQWYLRCRQRRGEEAAATRECVCERNGEEGRGRWAGSGGSDGEKRQRRDEAGVPSSSGRAKSRCYSLSQQQRARGPEGRRRRRAGCPVWPRLAPTSTSTSTKALLLLLRSRPSGPRARRRHACFFEVCLLDRIAWRPKPTRFDARHRAPTSSRSGAC